MIDTQLNYLVKRLRDTGDVLSGEAADMIERLATERDHYWPQALGKPQ